MTDEGSLGVGTMATIGGGGGAIIRGGSLLIFSGR